MENRAPFSNRVALSMVYHQQQEVVNGRINTVWTNICLIQYMKRY